MEKLRKDLIKIKVPGESYYNGSEDEDVISAKEIILFKPDSDFKKDLQVFNEFVSFFKESVLDMFNIQEKLHNSDQLNDQQVKQLKELLEINGMSKLFIVLNDKYNLPSLTVNLSEPIYSELLHSFLIKIGWEDLNYSIKSENELQEYRTIILN